MKDLFRRVAHRTSLIVGSPYTFIGAVFVIIAWAVSGHFFHYSDTWQLVINTGTTIITFLMVFLIQNTQNRDAQAMHLKLDELVRAIGDARNSMLEVENMNDDELARLHEEFHQLQYERIVPELMKRGKTPLKPGETK
jgi:low affinity Fe/Cu permease